MPATKPNSVLLFLFLAMLMLMTPVAFAQANYEVQVYPSDTVEPHNTIVEVHSNFTDGGHHQQH